MDVNDRRQRLVVAEAERKLKKGRMSRREFLRLCGEAGFAFSGLSFLGGCNNRIPDSTAIRKSAGPESAIEPRTAQQKFLRDVGRAFAGTTLYVVSEDTPPSRATRELMQEDFIPLTGINARVGVVAAASGPGQD